MRRRIIVVDFKYFQPVDPEGVWAIQLTKENREEVSKLLTNFGIGGKLWAAAISQDDGEGMFSYAPNGNYIIIETINSSDIVFSQKSPKEFEAGWKVRPNVKDH